MATNNTCVRYFARLDQNHYPIPGSMQGFPALQSPCGESCQWVQLQTTPYIAPSGTKVCHQPDGLRFYYQIGKNGQIVPNSLIATYTAPQSPGGCAYWIEYLKFC